MALSGLYYTIYSVMHLNNPSFSETAPLFPHQFNQGITQEIPSLQVGTNDAIQPSTNFFYASVKWSGYFIPNYSGLWTFTVNSDDNTIIWLGNNAVSGNTFANAFLKAGPGFSRTISVTVYLIAGTNYGILIHYENGSADRAISVAIYNDSGYFPSISNPSYGAGFFYTAETDATTTEIISEDIPCFKDDTQILTNNGYILIQDLKKGDLVKTLVNGFVPIDIIGKKEIYHVASEKRITDQLYKYSVSNIPGLFEDLIITGGHSILLDNFIDDEQRNDAIEINGDIYVTNGKYRVPAVIDKRCSVYEKQGKYTIYHLALENEEYDDNYGIYANGLLVESCSKKYLKEYSDMQLIE
jgi:hypothetical protein